MFYRNIEIAVYLHNFHSLVCDVLVRPAMQEVACVEHVIHVTLLLKKRNISIRHLQESVEA